MVFAETTGSSAFSAHGSGGSTMDPKADDDAVAAADEDELADADAVAMDTPEN
jgi:hypothetical protein